MSSKRIQKRACNICQDQQKDDVAQVFAAIRERADMATDRGPDASPKRRSACEQIIRMTWRAEELLSNQILAAFGNHGAAVLWYLHIYLLRLHVCYCMFTRICPNLFNECHLPRIAP